MISPWSRCGLIKDLYTVNNDFLGNRFWNLWRSLIFLLSFWKLFLDEIKFWSLRLKITSSAACLVWSGLKFIFHWNAQSLILAKSLFKSLADLVIFSTTKNKDVSSANNFAFDAKSLDKSYMYIRKNNETLRQV